MANTYVDMNMDFIIDWCQKNNQVAWLKEIANKTVDCKVYPRVNGKADKTQQPRIEKRAISFIQIKNEFCTKFMPEIMPTKKKKKTTIIEIINNL